jgi:quercetin dioxygenase-like cupin family protein
MGTAKLKVAMCTGWLVLFGVSVALAQDPTKTEPTHYKIAFENDNVQVVNIHYGPHEKSSLHSHPGGVVVVLTEGHLRFTDEKGRTHEVRSMPGEARWFPPFKHEVENLGDTSYNAVYVAVKRQATRVGTLKQPSPKMDETAAQIVEAALIAAITGKSNAASTDQRVKPLK